MSSRHDFELLSVGFCDGLDGCSLLGLFLGAFFQKPVGRHQDWRAVACPSRFLFNWSSRLGFRLLQRRNLILTVRFSLPTIASGFLFSESAQNLLANTLSPRRSVPRRGRDRPYPCYEQFSQTHAPRKPQLFWFSQVFSQVIHKPPFSGALKAAADAL